MRRRMVADTQSREVPYTVTVPQTRTRQVNITEYETVAERRTQPYTVMVAYTERQQVPVSVCRMVPRTITQRVAVPVHAAAACPTGACY